MAISCAMQETTNVSMKVYGITGQLIRTLRQAEAKPGYYTATWDGSDNHGRSLPAGVYFVTLEAGKQRMNRNVVLTGTR
jgi:flagellar hook assembly protein FlgD